MTAFPPPAPAGADLPLADLQPQPEGPLLPLPSVIVQRPRLWPSFLNGALITAYFESLLFVLILTTTHNIGQILLYTAATYVPLFACGGLLYAFFAASQRIEITAHGMTVCYGYQAPLDRQKVGKYSKRHHIGWHEIRIFAIGSQSRAQVPATFYLVAGATGTVEWIRIRRHMPWYPVFFSSVPVRFAAASKPRASFDAYDREMDALLNLIAAKTGLPLYDLRGIALRP